MCKDLKLKSVMGASLKAKRRALREAKGMSPKPGRHESRSLQEVRLSHPRDKGEEERSFR